jgi:hypothetical protein
MTMGTKHEVIKEFLARYLRANKAGKGAILNHLEAVVGMKRKSLVRRFRVLQTRNGKSWSDGRGRPIYYTKDTIAALKEVWEISEFLCGERLHPILSEYVSILKRDQMWKHSDEATGKLLSLSLGTMKDKIALFEKVMQGGGRSLTKPSMLKEVIPIRRGPWNNPLPGHGEIDTVAHCGNTVEGLFAYTVQYTDITTCWCLLQAQMGKDKVETLKSIKAMEERLIFSLLGLDPDSGAEFINWHIKVWCDRKKISLTRIRPGNKNDHGRIEQKNDKNVRKFAGYIRIDTAERLGILKQMYVPLEIFINHFLPSMRVTEKTRIGSKYQKKHDLAQTPYQRVLNHPQIAESIKQKLKKIHQTLNPKILHDEILRLRKLLFKDAKFYKI